MFLYKKGVLKGVSLRISLIIILKLETSFTRFTMFFHFLNPKLPWRKTKYQVLHIPPKSLSNSPIVSEICTTEQGNQNQFCYADFCTETKTVNPLVIPEFLPKMREAKINLAYVLLCNKIQNPNLVASDSCRKLRSISFHFLFFSFFILVFVLPFFFFVETLWIKNRLFWSSISLC